MLTQRARGRSSTGFLFGAVLLIVAFSVRGEVVVGKDALELDRLAASELSGYLSKLFTDQPNVTFLVGNPETNDAIAKDQFPTVSDQGIVLKSVQYNGHPAIIVGGAPTPFVLLVPRAQGGLGDSG